MSEYFTFYVKYNKVIYLFKKMLQVQNAFGLFGIDIIIKSADGKILDNNLLKNIKDETIIVQKNNVFDTVKVHQTKSPITQ